MKEVLETSVGKGENADRVISFYTLPNQLSPFSHDKILDWSKFEHVADNIQKSI